MCIWKDIDCCCLKSFISYYFIGHIYNTFTLCKNIYQRGVYFLEKRKVYKRKVYSSIKEKLYSW
jgi:hypothetical protein